MGLRPSFAKRAASLEAAVVLPAPCKPNNRIIERVSGPFSLRSCFSSPKRETILSWIIFTNCWPGSTARRTFSPLASSMVLFTNRRTTRRLTSASSRASLICSTVSSIFFSVMEDFPLSLRTTSVKVLEIFSNILTVYGNQGLGSRGGKERWGRQKKPCIQKASFPKAGLVYIKGAASTLAIAKSFLPGSGSQNRTARR